MEYRTAFISDYPQRLLSEFYERLCRQQREYIRNSNPESARRSLAARALLTELIREKYGEDCAGRLYADQNGQLHVDGMNELYVSISHSKEMVAAVLCDRPVGIDIEKIRPLSEKLKKKICDPGLPTEEDHIRLWTVKEAYLKAFGISFAQMLGMNEQDILKKADIFSKKSNGHYLSVAQKTEKR